jgi:hypothetical protein
MINCTSIRLVFGVAALFGADEGTVTLTPGFPIAVPKTGCAIVFGSVRPERGYTLSSVTATYWENGGVSRNAKAVIHADGSFCTIISGLTPGASYNVFADAAQIGQGMEILLRTAPATIKAR